MEKHAVFIIKPDFISKLGLIEVANQLKSQGLTVDKTYKINEFYRFSIYQRLREVALIADKNEASKKFEQMKITIDAYKAKYKDHAIAIVIKKPKNMNENEFFERADNVKTNIRKKYVRSREYSTFAIQNDDNTTQYIVDKFDNYDKLRIKYHNVKLVMFNCIHFSSREEFDSQEDYNICRDYGIFDSKNEIKLQVFNQNQNIDQSL